MRRLRAPALLLLAAAPAAPAAPAASPDPVVALLEAEIGRVMEALADADEPPYYLSYQVVDRQEIRVTASFGALGGWSESRSRGADVDVRVGSPELDNTHKLRDAPWFADDIREEILLPVDGDPVATRALLWRATDDAWQAARRRMIQLRANESVKVEREDNSADFSEAPVEVWYGEPAAALDPRVEDWVAPLEAASAALLDYPDVYSGAAELTAEVELRVFVSSEGTRIQEPRVRYRAAVWASTVAEDGMQLQVYEYDVAHSLDGLGDPAALVDLAHEVAQRTEALREAPMLEPYTGPAILRGRAAGVFFHEVFGHRIEGHRQKDEDEGQTFKDMVGEPILPAFLSVYDDPTITERADTELNGHYRYDDEGVLAQRVPLVEDGVLQTFLLARQPVGDFDASNGHGRRQSGNAVVPRQGNLMIEASETVPYEDLRAQLLEEIREQGKPFGLIVDDITGGFTLTGRVIPNSFNVRPVSVWKVYADGRPDELVRGGDLIGTPLTTFSRILAAGDDPDVFNGVCGAESGWVPVSASSPSLLLSELEVQRKEKDNDRPPLLPAPGAPERQTEAEGT